MTNIEIIGNRIRELRLANHLEQSEIASLLGYKSDTTISKWENGKNLPNGKRLTQLAQILNTSTDYILHGQSPSTTPTEAPSELVTAITDKVLQLTQPRQESVLDYASDQLEAQKQEEANKVIDLTPTTDEDDYIEEGTDYISDYIQGIVSAGPGSYQEDDLYMEVKLPASEVPDQYNTIAKVVGDSMKPIIEDSDLLFIEAVSQVDPNTIGIFQVNGKNYVKKLRHDQNGIPYLQSLNPNSDDIFLNESDDIRTIGEVVEIYRER